MLGENKTLLLRYVDGPWHKRNLGVLGELRAPRFIDHADNEVRGPEGVRRFRKAYREAFPEEERLSLP
jgi:hypothetical protein